jgi:hypothetical protein
VRRLLKGRGVYLPREAGGGWLLAWPGLPTVGGCASRCRTCSLHTHERHITAGPGQSLRCATRSRSLFGDTQRKLYDGGVEPSRCGCLRRGPGRQYLIRSSSLAGRLAFRMKRCFSSSLAVGRCTTQARGRQKTERDGGSAILQRGEQRSPPSKHAVSNQDGSLSTDVPRRGSS